MGNQAAESQAVAADQFEGRIEVPALPFGGDSYPGLALESGRKGETHGGVVEAGENDLPCGRQA
jgi:hypothetical protein